jgi:UDP-N-acetylmuramate dehydrogenase
MSRVELRSLLSGITGNIRFDEPMSRYTSFRIGGPADAYVEPADV